MKICLVNPKFPITIMGQEYTRRITRKRSACPSLSLVTIAGLTPAEVELELCDENVQPIRWDSDAEVIALTGMHIQRPRLLEIARRFRARGKCVVIGGPSVMAMPQWYRQDADVLIRGEAEYLWPRFLQDLAAGALQAEYHETRTVDLRDSPMPRYELVTMRDYSYVGMQTTRGCPFTCEFCDIIVLYGRNVRTKPVPQAMAEFERLLSLGARRIFFVDDNFIGNPSYARELLEAIRRLASGLRNPPTLICQASVNVAKHRDLLCLMYEAGMRSLFVGVESPRVSSLEETLKYQNVRVDLLQAIETIQSHGMLVMMGMVVGFDHDDPSIFDEQVEFITRANVSIVLLNQLHALPGTPLYGRMERDGRLREIEWWNRPDDAMYHESNIEQRSMTNDELNAGYMSMLLRLYEPTVFTTRVASELERMARMRGESKAVFLREPLVWLGFAWTLGWFLIDRDRRVLLEALWRVLRTAVRYRRVADAALMRLLLYRHLYRLTQAWERTRRRSVARASASSDATASLGRVRSRGWTLAPTTRMPVHEA